MKRRSRSSFTLALADGTRWIIRAGDAEAEHVTSALAAAMRLEPAAREIGGKTPYRELIVTVRPGRSAPPVNLRGRGPVICPLSPLSNDAMLTIGMTHVGLAIAREAQSRGGVLLHGALALTPTPLHPPSPLPAGEGKGGRGEWGEGILLAGPGTVGKSTASSRLPPPWRSLCDDTTLVVRDSQEHYWAHPWPTWSRFYSHSDEPAPGGSWDVQHAVRLRAVFFLSQSSDDRVEPLHVPQAMAMLMEAVQHVSGTTTRLLEPQQVHALHREQLAAVEALAQAIPAYILHISLTGAFWEEVERALQDDEVHPTRHVSRLTHHASRFTPPAAAPLPGSAPLYVAYTGPSMNPTLREPDLLEVTPYDGRAVQVGDVIYFEPPEEERKIIHRVIHRVIRVTPAGIRTRGDNNPTDDPHLLQTADVIGQVTTAQRGLRRRRIAGGRWGTVVGCGMRIWRVINRAVSRPLHGVYHALARANTFGHLLPPRLHPRLVVFQSKTDQAFKLVMGQREVGRYDNRLRQWTIQRPFRLFVDETRLPVISPPTAKNRQPSTTDEHLV